MGIMSGIGNIVSGVVGGGSDARVLGRLRGFKDKNIELAAAAQEEATKFYTQQKQLEANAAAEMMQDKK